MTRGKVSWVAAVVLLAAASVRADETLDQVSRRLDDLVRQYRTIRYKVKLISNMTYNGQLVRGSQEMDHEILRLPDGRALTRYEARDRVRRRAISQPGQPVQPEQVEESYALSVFDGQYLYDLRQGPKRIFAVKTKPARNPHDPVGLLQHAREQFDVYLLPERTFEGKEVYAIEFLTRPNEAGAVVRRIVTYTNRKTGLPIRTMSYDKEGRVVNIAAVVESHLNEDIPADRFVFQAPPGVQIEDRTAASSPATQTRPAAPIGAPEVSATRPLPSGVPVPTTTPAVVPE